MRSLFRVSVLPCAAALLLCAVPRAAASAPPPATTKPTVRCAPDVKAARWRHSLHGGRLASKLGGPRHVVVDAVVGEGQPLTLRGKFAFGFLSKDVEDEAVELWIEDAPCQ